MRAALATLPDDQREVIDRHYLQGESHAQIALAMGRTKDAIRGLCTELEETCAP
jgi:DNA-directed RNA polymerase specialized sigma24 family protein